MRPHEIVRMDAATMGVGVSIRTICPFCAADERCFSITRTVDGAVYNCHRATCGAKGFVASGAGHVEAPSKRERKEYEGELIPLGPRDFYAFVDHYEVDATDKIFLTEYNEYVLPISGLDGKVRGYNVRQPWPNMPAIGRPGAPKSKVYMHSNAPVMATYPGSHDITGTVVLVEDQLSAIKAAQHARIDAAVALLGTHLDIPRVQEIAKLRAKTVLLALDKDATSTAFKLAREYGLAFNSMRVVLLDQDIKDTPSNKINEVLGL